MGRHRRLLRWSSARRQPVLVELGDAEHRDRRAHLALPVRTPRRLELRPPPTAPILTDITVDGRDIQAVAQITKQSFVYVFDRVTGEPVWPIEERPVPQGNTPGEWYSPTQPFPTKPAPFDRQGVTIDDLLDFTPELRAEAEARVSGLTIGPLSASVGPG